MTNWFFHNSTLGGPANFGRVALRQDASPSGSNFWEQQFSSDCSQKVSHLIPPAPSRDRPGHPAGTVVTNGTDVPVENVDPIQSFYASVTRRMNNGKTFFPEQRMTRIEALRSYTINAAFAAFEEKQKGSLTAGKFADIVVLSQDILTCRDDELPNVKVLYTIVGGKVLFPNESLPPCRD
jgi:predicted amidohydrolase YtcJ